MRISSISLLCAPVLAVYAEGPVSSAVVGYATRDLPASGQFDTVAAMFFTPGQAVGESSITLGDIVLKNVTDATVIQLIHKTNGATRDLSLEECQAVNANWTEAYYNNYLNRAGLTAMPATFVYKEAANTRSGEAGWYLQVDSLGFYNMSNLVLNFGDGLIVASGDSNASFQFSGQVLTENYSYPIPTSGQFSMIANPCPTDKTLGDFVPDGATDATVLQLIHKTNGATRDLSLAECQEANSNWTEAYYNNYLNRADLTAMPATFVYKEAANTRSGEAGWYLQVDSFGFYSMNKMTVPAGTAFIIASGDNDAGIILPKENVN